MNLHSRRRVTNEARLNNFTFCIDPLQKGSWKKDKTTDDPNSNELPTTSGALVKNSHQATTEDSTVVSSSRFRIAVQSTLKVNGEYLTSSFLNAKDSPAKPTGVKVTFDVPFPRSRSIKLLQIRACLGDSQGNLLHRTRSDQNSFGIKADITPRFRKLNSQSGLVQKITFGKRNSSQDSSSIGTNSSMKNILKESNLHDAKHRRTFTGGCPLDLSSKRDSFTKLPPHRGDEAATIYEDTVGLILSPVQSERPLEKATIENTLDKSSRLTKPKASISMSISNTNSQLQIQEQKVRVETQTNLLLGKVLQRKTSITLENLGAQTGRKLSFVNLWDRKDPRAVQPAYTTRQRSV